MWFVVFDLDETLICCEHRLSRLTEVQAENVDERIRMLSPSQQDDSNLRYWIALYRKEHGMLFLALAESIRKGDAIFFIITAGEYLQSQTCMILELMFGFGDPEIEYLFSRANVVNRRMLLDLYAEDKSKLTAENFANAKARAMKSFMLLYNVLFKVSGESNLITTSDVVFVDDNVLNRECAKGFGFRSIDPTKNNYCKNIYKLTSLIKLSCRK
ncbi:hypothetical protein [Pelagibaculum spongiae]|uniref:FCP1 homology domain-containing protein n=1 Tax=Pelagibaculum spongiae TaxID=2080658 RepID=A0A2V1GYE8_9GAMM|nr:hypothetical protein [Pelagibaculum spongiae]PVZ65680.1 hypothetical protein DC094_17500 [Pelagibaculum spongiae]